MFWPGMSPSRMKEGRRSERGDSSSNQGNRRVIVRNSISHEITLLSVSHRLGGSSVPIWARLQINRYDCRARLTPVTVLNCTACQIAAWNSEPSDAAESDECQPAESDRSCLRAARVTRFQHSAAAVAHRGGVFYGVAGYHDPQHRGAHDRGGTPRCSAQHEVGAGKLHPEPCGFHSHQRLDGRPVRNPSGVRIRDWNLHAGVVPLRHIQQYPCARCLSHPAGLRRIHDGARRPTHLGADVRQIRTGSCHGLRGDPQFGWAYARSNRRRPDRRIPSLAVYFLCKYSDWPRRFVYGLPAPAGLPRTHQSFGCGRLDSFRIRCRPCCPTCWKCLANIL
jgi:hypothetical protein